VQFVAFDKEYVEKLAARESDTERHFVSYFGELLGIKLRLRVASSQLAEEIRQEVFLRVFRLLRKPNGIRQPERLGPLVNSICDHVVLEYRRSGGREPERMEADFDVQADAPDVETELLGAESSMAVRNVLETLPHREQLLLRAVYFDDQKRDAICEQQGVDREYLRVLLHRARLEFKDRYLKYVKTQP